MEDICVVVYERYHGICQRLEFNFGSEEIAHIQFDVQQKPLIAFESIEHNHGHVDTVLRSVERAAQIEQLLVACWSGDVAVGRTAGRTRTIDPIDFPLLRSCLSIYI